MLLFAHVYRSDCLHAHRSAVALCCSDQVGWLGSQTKILVILIDAHSQPCEIAPDAHRKSLSAHVQIDSSPSPRSLETILNSILAFSFR